MKGAGSCGPSPSALGSERRQGHALARLPYPLPSGPASGWAEINFSHDRLGAPPPGWLFGESGNLGEGFLYGITLAAGL